VKLYGTGTSASRRKAIGDSAELEEGPYLVMKNSNRLLERLVFMCTAGKYASWPAKEQRYFLAFI
jgi:hypothetical protein